MQPQVRGWKRFLMWDFPRGSVAYDVKVGAILAFIFLTPSAVFRDQPQIDKARDQIVMLPGSESESRFWLEESLISAIPETDRFSHVSKLIGDRTGKTHQVLRVEKLQAGEESPVGYIAITKP